MRSSRRFLPYCLILCAVALPPQTASAWWGDWTNNPSWSNMPTIGDCGWGTTWYIYGHFASCAPRGYYSWWNPGFVWNGHGYIYDDFYNGGAPFESGVALQYRNQAGGVHSRTDVNECAYSCQWVRVLTGQTNNMYDWNGNYLHADNSWTTCKNECGSSRTGTQLIHMWGDKWVYANKWTVFGGYASPSCNGSINDVPFAFPFAESGIYAYPFINTSNGNVIANTLFGGKVPYYVDCGDSGNAGNGNYLNFKGNAGQNGNNNCDCCNAYAFCWVNTNSGAGPQVSLGSDDGYRLWINGTVVAAAEVWRGVTWDGDNLGSKGLAAGWNRILFKVHNGGGGFGGVIGFHHGTDWAQMEPSMNLNGDRYGGFSWGYEQDAWYPAITVSNFHGNANPTVAASYYSNNTTVTTTGTSAGQGPVPLWQTMEYRWGYNLGGVATNYAPVSGTPTAGSWTHTETNVTGHRRYHFFAASRSGRLSTQASGSSGGFSWSSTYGKYYDLFVDNMPPQNTSFNSVNVFSENRIDLDWVKPLDQGVNIAAGDTEASDMTGVNSSNHYRRGDVGTQVYRNGTAVSAWSGSTVSRQDTGLTPNTYYTYTVEARDNNSQSRGAWANTTGQLNSTSLYTFAARPLDPDNNALTQDGNIASNNSKARNVPYPAGSTFEFTNPAGFGVGTHGGNQYKASKFKYVWDKLGTRTWDGSEPDWNSGILDLSPTEGDGSYFLHLQSWNEAGLAQTTTLNYGPFIYDGTPPSPGITINAPTYIRNGVSGSFTINFGEPVNGLAANEITVTMTGTANADMNLSPNTAEPSQLWTVTFSNATGDGTIKISVVENAATDVAGNQSLASPDSPLLTVDNIKPTPVITRTASSPTANTTLGFQIAFGETVQNFVIGDITLTLGTGIVSGSLSNFTGGSGGVYNVNVAGVSGTGTVGIHIDADLANDLAGNLSNAGTYVEYYVDQGALTCSITRTSPNPTNLSTLGYQISFNKQLLPNSFTTGDLQVGGSLAGGTSLANFTETQSNPAIWTVDVTGVTGTGSILLTLPASTVQDYVGNFNTSCGPVGYSIDQGDFDCTLSRNNTNPTNAGTVSYHLVFGKPVVDFDVDDITLGGTIGGTSLANFSGSGTTFDVDVINISGSGTVSIALASNVAHDEYGNKNNAAGPLVYNIDQGAPGITSINRYDPPAQVTNAASVTYRVTFSEAVANVSEADFTATVTSGDIVGESVIGVSSSSGSVIDVTVDTGSSGGGDLRLDVVYPGATITDSVGNPLTTGFNTGQIYTIDRVNPTVSSIVRYDPAGSSTNASSVTFRVTFSKNVNNVDENDFTLVDLDDSLSGEGVTGVSASSGTEIDVTCATGTGNAGHLRLDVNADTATIDDDASNPVINHFFNGQVYTIDRSPLTATITRTSPNPNNALSVGYNILFNKPVSDFTSGDITLESDIPGVILGTFSGSSTTYNVNVTNITASGWLGIKLLADVAHDVSGNGNQATSRVDYTIDQEGLFCTILRMSSNPTNAGTVTYQVTFNKSVSDFEVGDITLGGTIGGTSLSNFQNINGFVYSVDVINISGSGAQGVGIELAAEVAHDAASNANSACGPVYYNIDQAALTCNISRTSPNPTNASTVGFQFVFNKNVTNFVVGDITLGGTIGGTSLSGFSGGNNVYTVNVINISGTGTVSVALDGGVASDSVGNPNQAAGPVAYTISQTALTVTVNQGGSQPDPTNTLPIVFDVAFSDSVSDFNASDVSFGGTAVVSGYNVSGSSSTYQINVTALTSEGTITPSIAAARAHDVYGNPNQASTSTDNTVLFSTGEAPLIASFKSARTHTVGGELGLTLNASRGDSDYDPGPTTESRRFGIRRLIVQFTKPVELVGSIENSFSLTGWGISGSPSSYLSAVSNRTLNGSTLTIDFTPSAMPNKYRYKLTINNASFRDPETWLPVTGDLDCHIRSLEGNINSDPYVDASDLGSVKSKNREAANSGDNARYDLNTDGQINVIDMAYLNTKVNVDECP